MKTLITLITLLTSVSISAFTANQQHKDWSWSTEISRHGTFVALTPAMYTESSDFYVIVTPHTGECFVSYKWVSYLEDKGTFPDNYTFDGSKILFNVDGETPWSAESDTRIDVTGGTAYLQSGVSGDVVLRSIMDLLKGSKMASVLTSAGGDMSVKQFSLLGSSVAIGAVFDRCEQHVTSYPNYNVRTDSHNAIQRRAKKEAQKEAQEWVQEKKAKEAKEAQEKAQRTVADKATSI